MLQSWPRRTVVGDARAWIELAFEGFGRQCPGRRRHRAPPEPDVRIGPDRLLAPGDYGSKPVLDHAHQSRHGQAVGRAQLAEDVRRRADLGVLEARQGSAAYRAASRQLVQRPAAIGPQRSQALGNPSIDRVILQYPLFHIWKNISYMEQPQGLGLPDSEPCRRARSEGAAPSAAATAPPRLIQTASFDTAGGTNSARPPARSALRSMGLSGLTR